tara:strand:- start:2058 stop:3575 length:1518 start_codon:yes stop_codon:yes gene_type:complete
MRVINLMLTRITLLILFNAFLAFPFKNEIIGDFTYDYDVSKNELYSFNNLFELNTYDLKTGILINTQKILKPETSEINNRTWSGLYSGKIDLSPQVMSGLLKNLILRKIDDEKFYLFHDGGGLVMTLERNSLSRVDNSFPFMNKFFGGFIKYDNKIYHFGGYGLFRTNNTLLVFDEGNSNQWDEITFKNKVPKQIQYGIASFSDLLIGSDYYLIGGNSSFNNERVFNKSLLKFDFESYTWEDLGDINLDLSLNPLILAAETCFYVFDKDFFYQVQILNDKILKFEYKKEFNIQSLGSNQPYIRSNQTFLSINNIGEEFGPVSMNNYSNKFVHTFQPHNGKINTSIINKYKLDNIIDISSEEEIPLFSIEESRNQFFVPLLIILLIIITNLLHKALKIDTKTVSKRKMYNFENNELFFLETKINLDNNGLEILKMLLENDQITSNDIVAKLVDNGLSYDYASKVKNKIIESLNEKYEFITNSSESFINISKSSKDKRIQIISLLKN